MLSFPRVSAHLLPFREGAPLYLKSLTLKGFKSFASSTTLQLEPGITCVVGPNGSGKSNVVDALAWVMGEQGAKSLRGGKMEDVIFAGTSGRPPLGRAEVLLTIDNSDGALPIEYAEVTISRTMFRSGGSEYAINGTPCRLLDVQELLSDSGIGREMHVIVGQGQLDSILHATPEDRRGFIEEAAGVLKHRKRKEKALRKLDACDGNLTRLTDLLGEIRRQLKPLGRQAEVARRAAGVQADGPRRQGPPDRRRPGHRPRRARAGARRRVACWWRAARRSRAQQAEATRSERPASRPRSARTCPALAGAQETWFALSGLRERLRGTQSLAAERVRNAEAPSAPATSPPAATPRQLEAEAAQVREQESAIDDRGRGAPRRPRAGALGAAHRRGRRRPRRSAGSPACTGPPPTAARGWPGCTARSTPLRSRAAAADDEIGRLDQAREEALARATRAQRDFTALETRVAGLDAGEEGLDAEHEGAAAALDDLEDRLAKVREEAQRAERDRAVAGRPQGRPRARPQPQGRRRCTARRVRPGLRAARLGGRAAHRPQRLRDRRRQRAGQRRRRRRAGRRRLPPIAAIGHLKDARPGPGRPGARRRARPRRRQRLAGAARRARRTPSTWSPAPTPSVPRCARLLDRVAVVDDLAAARRAASPATPR